MNPFVIAFRRIIYSIPLKRLLVGLAVFGVLFASFSKAETVEDLITVIQDGTTTINSNSTSTLRIITNDDYGVWCMSVHEYVNAGGNNGGSFDFWYFERSSDSFGSYFVRFWKNQAPGTFCVYINQPYIKVKNNNSFNITLTYDLFRLDVLLNTDLPVLTSLECQQQYSLIPISSVDQNYCTTNNLCPICDCPNVGVSNLYINDIFHPGAFNVIMNIPEEIDWDYAYTNSGQNFNIDVVGYNQDFEQIEGWIQTNNYKPTSDDFTNIFKNFSNFGGLLVGALFVILVFYFVKKMFK